MMSTSCGAKTALIHKVVHELAEQPEWNVDRQTDGFQLYIYIYIDLVAWNGSTPSLSSKPIYHPSSRNKQKYAGSSLRLCLHS